MKTKNPGLEFSRSIAVDKIPVHGATEMLEPNQDERKKLAERFGLLDLISLRAEFNLRSARAERAVEVEGKLSADVVQQCVVTLVPLPAHIENEVRVLFAPPEDIENDEAGPSDPNEEDMEPIIGGVIDLGELASQSLGIALDPYPRKPGLKPVEAEYGGGELPQGPLAELAKLAKKPKDSG